VLIADGKSTKEAAATLGISYKTADSHRSRILEKLACMRRPVWCGMRFALGWWSLRVGGALGLGLGDGTRHLRRPALDASLAMKAMGHRSTRINADNARSLAGRRLLLGRRGMGGQMLRYPCSSALIRVCLQLKFSDAVGKPRLPDPGLLAALQVRKLPAIDVASWSRSAPSYESCRIRERRRTRWTDCASARGLQ